MLSASLLARWKHAAAGKGCVRAIPREVVLRTRSTGPTVSWLTRAVGSSDVSAASGGARVDGAVLEPAGAALPRKRLGCSIRTGWRPRTCPWTLACWIHRRREAPRGQRGKEKTQRRAIVQGVLLLQNRTRYPLDPRRTSTRPDGWRSTAVRHGLPTKVVTDCAASEAEKRAAVNVIAVPGVSLAVAEVT